MIQKYVSIIFSICIVSKINVAVQTTINPDTYLTPPKIIRRNGYPAEAHIIQSEDGYLLEYHRIPFGKVGSSLKKPYPILLHHGVLCSSFDWIINGPEKSLGYQLADDGYDVWMANARGNTYSRSHISLDPKQKEFWNYTFHEMGIYDLPASIDYILNTTNSSKLIYIGHSLGTTVFFVLCSSKPEYNNKILVQLSIAPVAMLSHTLSAFKYVAPYAEQIEVLTGWYYGGAFLEHDLLSKLFTEYFCGREIFDFNICEELIIFQLFGDDAEQFNKSLHPLITSHMPAGTSSKNMIHCSQLINSGNFAQYNYGLLENFKRYNSAEPPLYDLSKISVPIQFYYANNDFLAHPIDVNLLYQNIPKPLGLTLIEYEKWNHVDFLWGVDANELFNHQLRQLVKNVINSPDFILSRVEKALVERNQDSVLVDESSDDKNFLNNNNNEIYTFANITKFTQNNLIYRVSSEYSYIIKQKYDVKAEDPKNGKKDQQIMLLPNVFQN